jgi:hypothetical protein
MILADSRILPARSLRYIFMLGVLLFVYLDVPFAAEQSESHMTFERVSHDE